MRGIRHDKVNHCHLTFDFFYTVCTKDSQRQWYYVIADSNACVGIYVLLTAVEILEVFAIGILVPSLLVCLLFAALMLWSLSQLACEERGFLKSIVRLAWSLGGCYHVPDCALDTDMLGDLGSGTCCLCLHFPPVTLLMVVLTLQTAWSCTVAKL